jgi:hypothetical protein
MACRKASDYSPKLADVKWIKQDASAAEAVNLMAKNRLNAVPVVCFSYGEPCESYANSLHW